MTMSHFPSLGLTSGVIYKVDSLIENKIATLSISESFTDTLYKYGICGDTNNNDEPALFGNVSISSLSTNMVSTEDIRSHFLREKLYNLTKPISSFGDFTVYSDGMLTYGLADPDRLNIYSLNIIGKLYL